MKKNEKYDVYYNRMMCKEIEDLIKEGGAFHWLIDFVKEFGNELDFQTGEDYFSVYRGTGRLLRLKKDGSVIADDKYMKLYPQFYEGKKMTPEGLRNLIAEVNKVPSLGRYYISKGQKKEGYFQNLISRRYTFNAIESDDFIVFDKEFVPGFKNDDTKKKKRTSITSWFKEIKEEFQKQLPNGPKEIKMPGTECDFLAVTKAGEIMPMELKRAADSTKVYLAPLQVSIYVQLLSIYRDNYWGEFTKEISQMVVQKKELGLINPDWRMPKLQKRFKPAVIVGEDETQKISAEVLRRYKIISDLMPTPVPLYTCDKDGTLIRRDLQ